MTPAISATSPSCHALQKTVVFATRDTIELSQTVAIAELIGMAKPGIHQTKFECLASEAASRFSMQKSRLIAGRKSVFRMLVAFGLTVVVPSLYAQQNKAGSDSPQAAWSNIQQFVKDMETAVQSKNLHGIHEPSMKIRAPIKTLKQHSSMLSGDKVQKIGAALKQLDTSVTDLHSASDEGSQADAETALKAVESALDQLKAQDPEAAFRSMH